MNVRGIAQAATLAMASSLLVLGIQQPALAVSPDIVISQVYGAGGNANATLKSDFIELYNRGTETVVIDGWSVQYASSTGTSWAATPLTGQIPPGEHYLVKEAQGAGGTVDLPTPDATGTIAMSGTNGKVALVTTTVALTCGTDCDTAAGVRDFVGYGTANDSETAPTPPTTVTTTAALRNLDGATDTDNNSADFTIATANPRNCGEDCVTEPPPDCDPPPDFEIAAIQGSGASTPIPGQCVRTEGVVTGDFNNDAAGLGGFYMQDDTPDADPATSDGIFVPSTTPVAAGDRVQVDGTAAEANGQTQVSEATVIITNTGNSITPLAYALPRPVGTTFEPVEGVLLTFPEALTVTEHFQLGRFGEIAVSSEGRLFQPTDRVDPGAPAQALAAENAQRRLLVDDGSNVQNPPVVPYSDPLPPRIGDTTTGLTGVLGFGFSVYRLQPTAAVSFTESNPRPAAPEDVGGDIQIASFNTLNYFTTLTTENPDARGANSPEEFARQQVKEVEAITGLDAEILGLMEVENNGTEAIASLVQALNDATAPGTYAFITPPELNPPNEFGGTFGTDAIMVAIIYKPAAVTPIGGPLTSSDPVFDRPPLIQTFERVGGSEQVSVVVNHFKSKNCAAGSAPGDTDQGDGQSCFNERRVLQATALLDVLDTLDVPRPLIIGDLNSYTEEDPIHLIEDAGYTGLSELFIDEDQRYSFVFDGFSGELDHGLASPELLEDVTGATIWHINADEALILDYNLDFGRDPNLYEPNAYRSSDHDPLIIGLDLELTVVVTPPAAPVVSVVVGPEAATVSWTTPDDGGSPITGYTVTVRQGETVVESVDVGADVSSYTFGGLTNGVAYQFEVVATNEIGDSEPGSITGTPIVPASYQRLDAEVACPGFTVTNPNAFPVSYSWKVSGRRGVGVVAAGETELIVGADASKHTTHLVLYGARDVDDRVKARC